MTTAAEYKRAERELTLREGRRGWRIHATVYAAAITALVTLNLLLVGATDAGFFWFPFPLIGWGIGLTMHYLYGVRWADREIRSRQAQIDRHVENSVPQRG